MSFFKNVTAFLTKKTVVTAIVLSIVAFAVVRFWWIFYILLLLLISPVWILFNNHYNFPMLREQTQNLPQYTQLVDAKEIPEYRSWEVVNREPSHFEFGPGPSHYAQGYYLGQYQDLHDFYQAYFIAHGWSQLEAENSELAYHKEKSYSSDEVEQIEDRELFYKSTSLPNYYLTASLHSYRHVSTSNKLKSELLNNRFYIRFSGSFGKPGSK